MQLIDNVIEELGEKRKVYLKKANQISETIEQVKKIDLDQSMFRVKIYSNLVWDGGKDLTFQKRGKLEDILKEAIRNFERINKGRGKPRIMRCKIYLFLDQKGGKIIKIPINEKCFERIIEAQK
ncbi:MAG TPA: hypothetical protein PKI00_00670 [Candidatus Pacearchaeota archaeon]|nr:hypothetical protein [Candidatus Pacearchaeota archaeon]